MSDSAPVLERYLRAKILSDIALNQIHGVKLTLHDLTGNAEIKKQIALLDTEIKKLTSLVDQRVNKARKDFDRELTADIDFEFGSWNENVVQTVTKPKRKKGKM